MAHAVVRTCVRGTRLLSSPPQRGLVGLPGHGGTQVPSGAPRLTGARRPGTSAGPSLATVKSAINVMRSMRERQQDRTYMCPANQSTSASSTLTRDRSLSDVYMVRMQITCTRKHTWGVLWNIAHTSPDQPSSNVHLALTGHFRGVHNR